MASPSTVLTLGYGSFGSPSDVLLLGYGSGEGEELPARRVSFVQQPTRKRRRDIIARATFETPVGVRWTAQCRYLPVIRDSRIAVRSTVGMRSQVKAARQRGLSVQVRVSTPAGTGQVARQWGLQAIAGVGASWRVVEGKGQYLSFRARALPIANKRRRLREEAMLLGIPLDDVMLLET